VFLSFDVGMKNKSLIVSIFLLICGVINAQSHLLLVSQGDGGLTTGKDGGRVTLKKATFLPSNQMISVRPRSGIETMAAGYNFRFGADTKFMILDGAVELNAGSLLVKSRNIKNSTLIKGPEANLSISGAGTCLIEVGTSGGFKIVGVLGRFRLDSKAASDSVELMPGELCFLMPGDRGFGDRVNVNLKKLISTSYLLSGFPNPKSFMSAMENIAEEQQKAIGKSFNAQVGDSKNPESFEIITQETNGSGTSSPSSRENLASQDSEGYVIPASDPLSELLGRSPRRFAETINVRSQPEKPAVPDDALKTDVQDSSEINDKTTKGNHRPFPSRLLRKP